MLEAGHVRGQRRPLPPLGGELLQGQPAPVADLDGVGAAAGGEQAQHVALEKGRVHAELQGQRPAQTAPQAVDQLAQERGRLLGVVHVARAILEPQDVARLGDMGHERVVAEILPVMGIEAAEGPGHRGAGADDGAVDVDGQARHVEARERLDHEVVVELDQRAGASPA